MLKVYSKIQVVLFPASAEGIAGERSSLLYPTSAQVSLCPSQSPACHPAQGEVLHGALRPPVSRGQVTLTLEGGHGPINAQGTEIVGQVSFYFKRKKEKVKYTENT